MGRLLIVYLCKIINDMDKERYLFLDIDGVLNTTSYAMACQWKYGRIADRDGAFFDPYTVENLKHIIETISIKIVISSSWRMDGINRIKKLWQNRNMPGEIFDITPTIDDSHSTIVKGKRGTEIEMWLRENPIKQGIPDTYAIIDDEDDVLPSQANHLFITDEENGLTEELAEKIIEILR